MIILSFIGGAVLMIVVIVTAYLFGYESGVDAATRHMLNLLKDQEKKRPKSFKERLNEEMSINKINLN